MFSRPNIFYPTSSTLLVKISSEFFFVWIPQISYHFQFYLILTFSEIFFIKFCFYILNCFLLFYYVINLCVFKVFIPAFIHILFDF